MKYRFIYICLLFFITGCATTMYPPVHSGVKGAYHIVRPKETLWSIAKQYAVNVNVLAQVNRIPDTNKIEKGQRIFIPEKTVEQNISLPKKQRKIEITNVYGENFNWPVKGQIISSFGQKKGGSTNNGIDIKVSEGTDIRASKSGTVTFYSDAFKGYGKTLIIDHGNGYQTVYAYNSIMYPKEGDFVKQGQIIARSGKTGRAKTASLHFEIRKKHAPVNPRKLLR
jgi:murein DD-endopeptidase MepM/ murein hydrolase activator NlpD